MRSGVPLHIIRSEALIEAGQSDDPAHSTFTAKAIDLRINRVERQMASEHEWPMLHFEQDVTVPADARFVSFPDDIRPVDVQSVYVQFGQEWLRVVSGIAAAERSIYTNDMRATPIARWEITADADRQFEVWPIGAVPQILRFSGQRAVGVMKDENDTCTLDADVIVLRVAAEMLARERQEDAAYKSQMAESLTQQILKNLSRTADAASFSTRPGRIRRPGLDYIAPKGSQ